MSRRLVVGVGALLLITLSGLVVALPLANAQTTVSVSIPSGADVNTAPPGYSPGNVTVVLGVNNTVVWTNNDASDHTVTSTSIPAGATAFDSGLFATGKNFTQTFTIAGTYEYHCTIHSWMTGSVIVKPLATSTPEFPAAYLAVILLAVITAATLVAKRARPTLTSASETEATIVR
jgi:plastocyanin